MNKRIEITLLEDLILSQRAATTGEHQSLSYLPGSTLLGAVASQLYARDDLDTFNLFHSGAVRFGNAYPVAKNGDSSVPMPFCIHYPKGAKTIHPFEYKEDGTIRSWLKNSVCVNLAKAGRDFGPLKNEQPKQLRDGFLTDHFEKLDVQFSIQLKTAISPESGRAANAQLFGYQSLRAGQTFAAEIQLDESAEELWPEIEKVLKSGIVLGRSRSAEFGRVRISVTDKTFQTAPEITGNEVVLLAVSDWLLVDTYGAPQIRLTPELLGLSEGKIDWSRSFVRSRSYSPYNAWRRTYDAERQVIQQGSVVTLTGITAMSLSVISTWATAGLGLFREQGLGRVCVNATVLSSSSPGLSSEDASKQAMESVVSLSTVAKPTSSLMGWLDRQSGQAGQSGWLARHVDVLAQALQEHYRAMRIYANLPSKTPCGPGKTQWGRIAELGKAVEIGQQGRSLFKELQGEGGSKEKVGGILGEKDAAWSQQFFYQESASRQPYPISIGEWLVKTLKDLESEGRAGGYGQRELGTLCQLLARRAQESEIQNIREGL